MTPSQLRLARFMLDLTQSDLAAAASVSRATIHRYEAGSAISLGQVKLLRIAIEAAGAVIIADGTVIDGVPLYGGVALRVPTASTPVIHDGASQLGEPSSRT